MTKKDQIILNIVLKEMNKLKIGQDIKFNLGRKRFRLIRTKIG